MKFLLLSLLALVNSESVQVQGAGDRIVGGSPAPLTPWMVSLQTNGYHFCGGQLLNANTVLTAGHCAQGQSASRVRARFGITNLDSAGGENIQASRIVVHPQFNGNTLANDVAIIKLATPARTTQFVQLDLNGAGVPGTAVKVIGWGNIRNGGPSSRTLLQVDLKVVADAECTQALQGYNGRVSVCCHGATDYQTPCNGDSGGPLVANGNVLVGTVSYGDSCVGHSVFARVSALKAFIQQNL